MRLFIFTIAAVMWIAVIPTVSQAEDFQTWLNDLRVEAQKRGVSNTIFNAALGDAKPIKRVIELDRSQPEFTLTFDEYLNKSYQKRVLKKPHKN